MPILSGAPSGLAQPIAADVGCGTGIATRLLAQRGVSVTGIDPNADMLDEARRRTPAGLEINYRVGRGESTGLADASVDLVLCAQSFHWFDAPAALREFHRILKPGGRLALMWNLKEDGEAFSATFTGIAERAQRDPAGRGLRVPSVREAYPTLGDYFRDVQRREFPNPQALNLDGVLGRMRSASYFPKSGPVRAQMEAELIESFNQHQRDGVVTLQQRTEVTLAVRG